MKYLVDTNIWIYYLGGDSTAIDFIQAHQDQIALSCISYLEVLSYSLEPEKEIIIRQFLSHFPQHYTNRETIEQAIQFRKNKKIKVPDNLIAATAYLYGLQLVTRNTKDFKGLPIEVIDPYCG